MIAEQDILVVKLGGGEGLDMQASCDDLAALALARPLVIVHGVSAAANQLCQERGIPVRTLTSPTGHASRYTDEVTRDIFVEAAQRVNHQLVEALRARGVNAIGLNDALLGERKQTVRAVIDGRVRIVRDDYTGTITNVNAAALYHLLAQGYTPVLPPLATNTADGLLNVDGDRASAAVAGALGARELVILSNVRGLYRSFPDETSFVSQVPAHQINSALLWAQGRMKRKVLGAQEALNSGVLRVIVADGRASNPVRSALEGAGTVFSQ